MDTDDELFTTIRDRVEAIKQRWIDAGCPRPPLDGLLQQVQHTAEQYRACCGNPDGRPARCVCTGRWGAEALTSTPEPGHAGA